MTQIMMLTGQMIHAWWTRGDLEVGMCYLWSYSWHLPGAAAYTTNISLEIIVFNSCNHRGIVLLFQYIGCLEVNTSMKSLDFDTRSQVARWVLGSWIWIGTRTTIKFSDNTVMKYEIHGGHTEWWVWHLRFLSHMCYCSGNASPECVRQLDLKLLIKRGRQRSVCSVL